MSPLSAAVGLEPVAVPGIAPRTEQPEDQRFLCWGELPDHHLRIGRRRARKGIWLRWEGAERRAPVRTWVGYDAEEPACLAPLQRQAKGLLPAVRRWIQAVRHNGGQREVLVELLPGVNHELALADLRDFHLFGDPPALRPDPDDGRPLGDRAPVFVSHGLLWDSPHLRLSGVAGPIFFNNLRGHKKAKALRDKVKWYAFDYPCWRHPAETGAFLSRAIAETLERDGARRPAVLIGHSMGGVVQRFAMNHEALGDRVSLSISAGSPHRGALITSLAAATGNLRLQLSGVDITILREGFGNLVPDCPGARALFWDNEDGGFNRASWEAYELPTSPDLAKFNRGDAYLSKLLCLAGDCPRLGLHPWISPHERIRWAQAHHFEGFENTDPFVPLASATFAGAPVDRSVHPAADHLGWALWSWQLAVILDALAERL